MNRQAHVACNFYCMIETEGFLQVIGSNIHCACGNISETLQDIGAVTADHLIESDIWPQKFR